MRHRVQALEISKLNFYYLLFITSGFLLIKKLNSCKCVMFLNYFRDTYDTTGDTITTGSTGSQGWIIFV